MSAINPMQTPKLRPLDIRPIEHEGSPYLLLRDPQQLSEHQLIVPQPLATVMAFFDGQHTVPQMIEAFRRRYAVELPGPLVAELVAALDEASMLENARWRPGTAICSTSTGRRHTGCRPR
ncbi:MAG: hypothetical protein IPK16_31470 [Anaerolineales bacterium]|nr:hypothetical protein [Anaerolineales bacterium]